MSTLKGITVLITRSAHQSGELKQELATRGALALDLPVIAIGPPDSWERLDTAIGAISSYDWIIFTSTNSATIVLERATTLGADLSVLKSRKIASIGRSTTKKLIEAGFQVDFQPSSFVAESLLAELLSQVAVEGKRFLYPRNSAARSLIADTLSKNGAFVDAVDAYQASLPNPPDRAARDLARLFAENKIDVITLASAQSARNFATLLELAARGRSTEALGSNILIATIGPVTSSTARQLFGRVDVEAEPHTVQGLVESLERHFLPD